MDEESALAKLFKLCMAGKVGQGQLLRLPFVENMRARFNAIVEERNPFLLGILRQTKQATPQISRIETPLTY
jgi:hypothetical protein